MKIVSMKPQAVLILALTLVACAGPDGKKTSEQANAPAEPENKLEAQFAEAATTPLSDINLIRAKIPELLISIQKKPYLPPQDQSCESLSAEVHALDGVLGADLDVLSNHAKPGLIERGTTAANNAAVGAVKGVAQSIVPYRGWVRKLSGAEKNSKEVAAAIAAGGVRRAFLKGIRHARGCPAPVLTTLVIEPELETDQ